MNQQQINRINEIVAELNVLLPQLEGTHFVDGSLERVGDRIVGLQLSMVALVVEDVPAPEPKGKSKK